MLLVMNYSLTFDCLFMCVSNRPGLYLTNKIFRKKRIIHQKKPIRDPISGFFVYKVIVMEYKIK